MMPRVVCAGHGYACQFAGWVLARSGADVRTVVEGSTTTVFPELRRCPPIPADAAAATDWLAEVDLCITDDIGPLAAVVGGAEPWPPAIRGLTLVELGWPAARPDANSTIALRTGIGAAIGEPDGPGLSPPGRMLEALVGVQAAAAGIAAWLGAQRDGLGEHVRIDPLACVTVVSGINAIQFLDYGNPWRRAGRTASGSGGPFPFRMFRCRDGWVVAICRSRAEWTSLVAMLGDPPWSRRPELDDPLRIARHHADEVAALIETELVTRDLEQVLADGRRHRVPLAPLRSVDEALDDPRLFTAGRWADPIHPVTVRPVGPGHARRRGTAATRPARAPLAGLRVLDLGWVWAAPIATSWLADLGADVVKVESFDHLDPSRRRGLEFPAQHDRSRPPLPGHERTWLFHAANRNKRSIRLELKEPADRQAFLDLVARADVVVESFSAGVLERLDLAPDVLLQANPGLVLLSMGGRAVDGEYVTRSYAPMLSALAGIESQVVDREGAPLGLLNWGVADPNAACWAVLAVLAALAHGGGAHLVLSQLRALVNTCLASYRTTGSGVEELEAPEEVTTRHLLGEAPGPLGDTYRRALSRDWAPDLGERRALGSPWAFRRMPVGVRVGAPTFGSTALEDLRSEWMRCPVPTVATPGVST